MQSQQPGRLRRAARIASEPMNPEHSAKVSSRPFSLSQESQSENDPEPESESNQEPDEVR